MNLSSATIVASVLSPFPQFVIALTAKPFSQVTSQISAPAQEANFSGSARKIFSSSVGPAKHFAQTGIATHFLRPKLSKGMALAATRLCYGPYELQ